MDVNEWMKYECSEYKSLSYTILLEDLLGIKKCPQKHGGSDAIAMTTGP
jgi:hypothetical protein